MADLIDSITKATPEVYNLRVVTAVRFGAGVINSLTNMTYFFDGNWEGTEGYVDGRTLPIAFFDLLTERVTQQNEVSNRRVMVYEGTGETTVKAQTQEAKQASLNAISDNVVVNPISKTLEVLVPYGSATYLFTRVTALIDAMPILLMSNLSGSGAVSSALRTASEAILTFTTILRATMSAFSNMSQVVGKLGTYTAATLNLDSLIGMARNRSVVMYKPFDSWDFKYVVIENVDYTKKGTERNYVRCTITIREVPVLAIGTTQLRPTMSRARSLIGRKLQSAVASFVKASSSVLSSLGGQQ